MTNTDRIESIKAEMEAMKNANQEDAKRAAEALMGVHRGREYYLRKYFDAWVMLHETGALMGTD